MSSDLKKINHELLENLIWHVKSKEYYDKSYDKKDVTYDIIFKKYRLVGVNTNKGAVIKKINSFTTNYRREKKKVEEPYFWYWYR